MSQESLLFFTYADARYDFFAVPYAFFALTHNPHSYVEIVLEDYDGFVKKHNQSIEKLESKFPGRTIFRGRTPGIPKKTIPNTVRFLEEPKTSAKYVYIGDIDILIFEDVAKIHIEKITQLKLPFSNIIRDPSAEKPRLTGLHFAEMDKQYPLADVSDLDLSKENDEHILFEMMRRKGLHVPESYRFRPECGIHVSLNRDPIGRSTGPGNLNFQTEGLDWGGKKYLPNLKNLLSKADNLEIIQSTSIEFRSILLTLEAMNEGALHDLHWMYLSTIADRSLFAPSAKISFAEISAIRDTAINSGDINCAAMASIVSNLLWPKHLESLKRSAWILIGQHRYRECAEILWHAIKISDDIGKIVQWRFISPHQANIQMSGNRGRDVISLLQKHHEWPKNI